MKKIIVIFLIFILLNFTSILIVPTEDQSLFVNQNQIIPNGKSPLIFGNEQFFPMKKTVNITEEEEPVFGNVCELYGDFEEYSDDYNNPVAGFDIYGNFYNVENFTYTDDVYAGTYSAYTKIQGTPTQTAFTDIYDDMGSYNPKLTEDLYFNISMKSNDDNLESGEFIYTRMRFYNGSFYTIYKYFSFIQDDSLLYDNENYTTTLASMNTNIPLNQWITIEFNLTKMFDDYFIIGDQSNPIYLDYLYIYSYSPQNASSPRELLFDEFHITNSTGFEYIRNGDIEAGELYWGSNSYSVPTFGTLSSETSTKGSSCFNMSITNNELSTTLEYLNFYQSIIYPTTFYPTKHLELEFDWYYNDTKNGGSDQEAYININFSNQTHTIYLYYQLGRNNDINPKSNATGGNFPSYYFNSTNFGLRGEWVHEKIDLNRTLTLLGWKNIGLYNLEFRIRSGSEDNSSVQLLLDDYQLITEYLGDQGFEEDWYLGSLYYPVTSWYRSSGNIDRNTHSNDAIEGQYSLNLTVKENIEQGVYRYNDRIIIKPETHFEFNWKLIDPNLGIKDSVYSYIRFNIEIEGIEVTLFYYTAVFDQTVSNHSENAAFLVNGHNIYDIWTKSIRNLYSDLITVFPFIELIDSQPIISHTTFYSGHYQNNHEITTLYDGIEFYQDTHSPSISEVIYSNVEYSNTPTILVNASDSLSGINNVEITYRTTGEWVTTDLIKTGDYYEVTLPSFDYDEIISFYITATDKVDLVTVDDNYLAYYTFSITDNIDPELDILYPIDGQTISGESELIISTSDIGSQIDYFEVYIDGTLIESITPIQEVTTSSLNTSLFSNGAHTLLVRSFDNAGNNIDDSIGISTFNEEASTTVSEILIAPTPAQYFDTVQISLAINNITTLENVSLHYKVDEGSWNVNNMTASGSLYSYAVQEQNWNSMVYYYISIHDENKLTQFIGNITHPFEYIVTDLTNPIIQVNGPYIPLISESVNFTIIASDNGSQLNKVEVIINDSVFWQTTNEEDLFILDTTLIPNGEYTIIFKAIDNANNEYQIELTYIIYNPEGLEALEEDFSQFMSDNGFIVGAISIVGLYTVFKVFMWRRHKKAA